MGQLIAGGLLVLGIIFLVAVVFIVRSEPDNAKPASVPDSTDQEVPDAPSAQNASDNAVFPLEATLPSNHQAASVADTDQVRNEWYPLANGQYYELLNELKRMRSQAQDLEHRLDSLIDMLQRVDLDAEAREPLQDSTLFLKS